LESITHIYRRPHHGFLAQREYSIPTGSSFRIPIHAELMQDRNAQFLHFGTG